MRSMLLQLSLKRLLSRERLKVIARFLGKMLLRILEDLSVDEASEWLEALFD